jgi:hypothetical protein
MPADWPADPADEVFGGQRVRTTRMPRLDRTLIGTAAGTRTAAAAAMAAAAAIDASATTRVTGIRLGQISGDMTHRAQISAVTYAWGL